MAQKVLAPQNLPRWEVPNVSADVVMPPEPREPATPETPATTTPSNSSWHTVLDYIHSGGEWVGLIGPSSNWLSRLSCAAVTLVLVSGMSLLLATSESPAPIDDVAIEAFRTGELTTSMPKLPANQMVVQQGGTDEGAEPVESAVYQTTGAPADRAAWLEGRIELE